MQTAKKGDTVLVNYIVRTSDGTIVGKTEENAPISLTIGKAEIFPEVEAALDGMEVGNETQALVSSENAFGPRRDEMIIEIPRAKLPPEMTPQPGMALGAQQPDGSTVQLTITAVGEDSVTADGNHPLAGQDLQFALELVEIKSAA
ncbi:FKBP-type peptidyl-prolyl cis-trans isomerase [Hyphobacterium marinum]|uniref:Peptidyl-prolyl cis-trans isomerase n=1 Tax=Hyphobacterium marinum TaxID=3116574 RepID=A0ABU7LXH5_9PROT|nr:peptidylprolyl isomerase [Hyphobacterium sp. Y6023]MEE2565982.1 peptidylprolyl isomerase [Hyphobacterium sp. Y6023]